MNERLFCLMDFWTSQRLFVRRILPLVSCFQPRPERKYRSLSLARLPTKLQRSPLYREVKHDAILELRRRCLIASCYRLAPSKYVLKTRAIHVGLWENNPSRLCLLSSPPSIYLSRSLSQDRRARRVSHHLRRVKSLRMFQRTKKRASSETRWRIDENWLFLRIFAT